MQPLKLTDDQLDAVLAAARPLDVDVRDAFLQRVAAELRACREIGPGTVSRICATVQREYFAPPESTHSKIRHNGKYIRRA